MDLRLIYLLHCKSSLCDNATVVQEQLSTAQWLYSLLIKMYEDNVSQIRPKMSRLGAEAAFAFFVLAFFFKPLFIHEKIAFCLSAPFVLLEHCVLSVAAWFKTVFSVTLMGNHRGTSCLCSQWCSVFNTRDTSSPETTRFFLRIDSQRDTWRSEQIRRMKPQACSRTHGQTCSSISVFYNRWGNHRCALMHAAEAAQVVGTVLSLCARVSVDFKDTTFVSEWKSYEMPWSTWDVQLSTGMQQR